MALSATVLSLCAGGGGLDLGLRLAVPDARTVCYVENEITACGVLAARMEDGGLDDAPLWTDLRTFDGAAWRGVVDIVIAGYPCQPFSNAGRQLGAADPRHLWPDVRRIVGEVQPRICFFENVGAHLRLGFREVASDLHALGYRVAAGLFTASEVGAPHKRERLFIAAARGVGHDAPSGGRRLEGDGDEPSGGTNRRSGAVADYGGISGEIPPAGWADGTDGETTSGAGGELAKPDGESSDGRRGARSARRSESSDRRADMEYTELARLEGRTGFGGDGSRRTRREPAEGCEDVGNAHVQRRKGRRGAVRYGADERLAWPPGPTDDAGWRDVPERFWPATPQPAVRGVVDGAARGMDLARSDRLHILGNGVVPQQSALAFRTLMAALS